MALIQENEVKELASVEKLLQLKMLIEGYVLVKMLLKGEVAKAILVRMILGANV